MATSPKSQSHKWMEMTHEHHDDGVARLDLFAFELAGRHGNTHVTLRSREALSLPHVILEAGVVSLLDEGLDFRPDRRILWAQEKLHDFVKLFQQLASGIRHPVQQIMGSCGKLGN